MSKTRDLFIALAVATLIAGCSSAPQTNDFGVIENAQTTVSKTGPEETWANFSGAVEKNRADVVRTMLAQGVSPNTLVTQSDPALVRAIRLDNNAVVNVLLQAKGLDVNTESRYGENALMLAIYKKNRKLAEELVERGAKVTKSGWTPLHYAATIGSVDMMEWLIGLGADVNAQTTAGVTPLYMAARMPSRQAVMTLLKHGAFRDLCTDRNESPAMIAAKMGDEELGKYLAVEKCVKPASKLYTRNLPATDGKPRMLIHFDPVKK